MSKDFGVILESLKWRCHENDDIIELCAHKHWTFFNCVNTRMWFCYILILDKSLMAKTLDKEQEYWTYFILFSLAQSLDKELNCIIVYVLKNY